MPGSMKTAMCEYARAGSVKRKDVGVGAALGVTMGGRPVGRMPKSCGRGCCCAMFVGESSTDVFGGRMEKRMVCDGKLGRFGGQRRTSCHNLERSWRGVEWV